MNINTVNIKTGFLVLLSMLFLTACGGGGGGGGGSAPTSAPSSAPALLIGFGVKQLQFSWNAVSGASYYRLFENPDGVSGFTQVGGNITAINATRDVSVLRHDWANARYLVQACNSVGCSADSNEVNTAGAVLQAIGYFKASNTGAADRFGGSIALSSDGNTLAVGAPNEASDAVGIDGDQTNNNSLGTAGAVYVFTRSGSTWSQQAYVKASNTDGGDEFGIALALSDDGNTLAVGARAEASNATGIDGDQTNDTVVAAGAVYVFTRSGSTWSQQAYVKASNTGNGDSFGWSLALNNDGNTLAVGAIGEASNAVGIDGDQTINTAVSAGAVYVFTRSGSTWSQQAYVKASNTNANDLFGNSLALSDDGNTLAVGAMFEASTTTGIDGDQTNNAAFRAGAVYVFVRSGSTWSQQAYVKASNTDANDNFGTSVALSSDGNTLAVGATQEASNAVGIDGDQANNAASSAGAAYVFTRSGSTWSQQAYVKASNTGADDNFGASLALSNDGNTLAVGAIGEASNATGIDGDQTVNNSAFAGAVYVFTRSGSTWNQQAYVKASNTGANDFFGWSLALNNDGNTLAVGAFTEASNATGINGDQNDNTAVQAGAVYLY